jgi:hypothetical protein
MATFGRKSAYKRAFKEAHSDGLRRPKKRPQLSTKYYEEPIGRAYD